jgi:hypothetical protein
MEIEAHCHKEINYRYVQANNTLKNKSKILGSNIKIKINIQMVI